MNGVPGLFIIDTGASFVSITDDFARRAKVPVNRSRKIYLATANGTSVATLTTIETVAIGRVKSKTVAAAVSDQKDFGSGVVGLLGMSFLARFDLSMQPTRIEIRKAR